MRSGGHEKIVACSDDFGVWFGGGRGGETPFGQETTMENEKRAFKTIETTVETEWLEPVEAPAAAGETEVPDDVQDPLMVERLQARASEIRILSKKTMKRVRSRVNALVGSGFDDWTTTCGNPSKPGIVGSISDDLERINENLRRILWEVDRL
jgi:hypothetical protein